MGATYSKSRTNTTESNPRQESKIPEYPHLRLSNFPKDNDGEIVDLSDGRKMGYKEYRFQHSLQKPLISQSHDSISEQQQKEFIILLIPGLPGSRLFCHPQVLESISGSTSNDATNPPTIVVRLFVLERPGIGLSTFAERDFLDFTNDIKEFCTQKNIMKCSLIAYSAGGPYGLAAAYALGKPQNTKKDDQVENMDSLIKKCAIISSVAPYDAPNLTQSMPLKFKIAWWLAKNGPSILSTVARLEAKSMCKNPVKAGRDVHSSGPPSDMKIYVDSPGVEEMFITNFLEMYSRGQVETECWEYSLWGKDWGFRLADIGKHPTDGLGEHNSKNDGVRCKVWHGEEDRGTTSIMGQYIAKQIDGCELEIVKEKGHMLYFEIWNEVIEWLISD